MVVYKYVCACVCMYVRNVHVHARTYLCMYVRTFVGTCVCMYVCMYEIQNNQRKHKHKSKTLQRQAQKNVITCLCVYVRKLRKSRQTDTLSIGCEGVQEVFFIWTTYVNKYGTN